MEPNQRGRCFRAGTTFGVVALLTLIACQNNARIVAGTQGGMGSGFGGSGGGTGTLDSSLPDPTVTFLEEIRSPALRAPVRMAMGGPRQRIVVSDADAHAVHIFTRTGLPSFSIAVAQPLGVAIDSRGQIYAGDQATGAVTVHDASGNLLRFLGEGLGEFRMPSDMAYDAATGLIHIVDSPTDSVRVYDAQGAFLRSYGSSGAGNGQLSFPSGIAIKGAEVYVADFANRRLQIFSAIDGSWKKSFGSYGVDKGQFTRPTGVAIDSLNRIYVTDTFTNILQVVDGDGLHVSWLGQSGTSTGQLSLPLDALIDPYSRLLVSSSRTSKIVVFGIDGYQQPKPEASAIAATVELDPPRINARSGGRWITATIEIPDGDVNDILVSTVRLRDIPADPAARTAVGDVDYDGIPDLMVKFIRADLLRALALPGSYTLALSAELSNGDYAEGEVTVEVIDP